MWVAISPIAKIKNGLYNVNIGFILEEGYSMKKVVTLLFVACLVTVAFVSCETTGQSSNSSTQKMNMKSNVKRPEIVDHKDAKWGKEAPGWVSMERDEIESSGKYGDVYIFKFESEKGKDLDGSMLWLSNFEVAREISRLVSQRVQDKAVAAANGSKNVSGAWTQEVTKTLSEATINGLKKESDYWVLRRFYDAKGEVEGDFYTALILYSVPKAVLDEIVKDAVKKANSNVPPKTQEDQKAYDLVQQAFENGF